MESKWHIRRLYKEKRKSLSERERKEKSTLIALKAIDFLKSYPKIEHVHVFLPIDRLLEIDTFLLTDLLFSAGFHVYTAVTQAEQNTMQTVRIYRETTFKADGLGIPTPLNAEGIKDEKILDIVFLPLLAFDLSGVRIGYGKGYYDRFLARLSPGTLKVGLSYFQPEDMLPSASYDILLDGCITPYSVFRFNHHVH